MDGILSATGKIRGRGTNHLNMHPVLRASQPSRTRDRNLIINLLGYSNSAAVPYITTSRDQYNTSASAFCILHAAPSGELGRGKPSDAKRAKKYPPAGALEPDIRYARRGGWLVTGEYGNKCGNRWEILVSPRKRVTKQIRVSCYGALSADFTGDRSIYVLFFCVCLTQKEKMLILPSKTIWNATLLLLARHYASFFWVTNGQGRRRQGHTERRREREHRL